MSVPLALVLSATAAAPVTEIVADGPRVPLAVAVVTTGDAPGHTSVSQVYVELAAAVRDHTDFAPAEVDARAVIECRGAVECLSRRTGVPGATHMMIVSKLGSDGPERVFAMLVDLKRNDEVLARAVAADLADPNATLAAVRRIVAEEFKSALVAAGRWTERGAVDIRANLGGATVTVDGNVAGTASSTNVRLVRVPVGDRTVGLRLGDEERTGRVKVTTRSVAVLELAFTPPEPSTPYRDAIFVSGLGAIAVGVGVVIYAGLRHDASVETICIPGCGGGFDYDTTGYDPSGTPAFGRDATPGGLAVAPLGAAVAIGGATWLVGTVLAERDDLWQVVVVAAGIVTGAATYAISTAFAR